MSTIIQLDYKTEMNEIKLAAMNSGKHIKLLSSVATVDTFSAMLRRKPRCLHISCHGIKNSPEEPQGNFNGNDGNFLLFE